MFGAGRPVGSYWNPSGNPFVLFVARSVGGTYERNDLSGYALFSVALGSRVV